MSHPVSETDTQTSHSARTLTETRTSEPGRSGPARPDPLTPPTEPDRRGTRQNSERSHFELRAASTFRKSRTADGTS